MTARDYYLSVQSVISRSRLVISNSLSFNEIDQNECYVRGSLTLINGWNLHVAEYVVTEPILTRLKYRYQLQQSDGILVSRWDNAPHHKHISTFPDHRHDEMENVFSSIPMDIPKVLDAIIALL